MSRRRWPTIEHHYGAYLITNRDGSTELVQSDWDYPATAQSFGWSLARVQRHKDGAPYWLSRRPRNGCEHRGTDGTIECPDCHVSASAFINAAAHFLDTLC